MLAGGVAQDANGPPALCFDAASSLDDATYATLSSLALFNNMEVVGALVADGGFLPQLFLRLCDTDPADPQWHDLVAFLQVRWRRGAEDAGAAGGVRGAPKRYGALRGWESGPPT